MADDVLQKLASAFQNAASEKVGFDADFITKAGATPPGNFDDTLRAAFRLAAPDPLSIGYTKDDVGAIVDSQFQITNATLSDGFLGVGANRIHVTLTFSMTGTELGIQIEVELQNWLFDSFFESMCGGVFDLLTLTGSTFIFSTGKTQYVWNKTPIALEVGQNYAGTFSVPSDIIQPLYRLFNGVPALPDTLVMYGTIALNKADNETILYPDMNVRAVISAPAIDLFYFSAHDPFIGFSIETVEVLPNGGGSQVGGGTGGGLVQTQYDQIYRMYLGAELEVQDKDKKTVLLEFSADVDLKGNGYTFALTPAENAVSLLTPQVVMSKLSNNLSYFNDVPPQLQKVFDYVGLNGLTLTGKLKSSPQNAPSLDTLSLSLGSVPGSTLTLFTDPVSKQSFAITDIDFLWVINDIMGKSPRNTVLFHAAMNLQGNAFRMMNGNSGWEFDVTIDQNFAIDAKLTGAIQMSDALKAVTCGAMGMPDGVSVTFSDISLALNPAAKRYSFFFTVNAVIDFIQWNGKPLIQFQDMLFTLAAQMPVHKTQGSSGSTVYTGSIQGSIAIGDAVSLHASVAYDGSVTPKLWKFQAELTQSVALSELIGQLFAQYNLPAFLPGTLSVSRFRIDGAVPVTATGGGAGTPKTPVLAGAAGGATYSLSGAVQWQYAFQDAFDIDVEAALDLAYDARQPAGKKFSGSVTGTLVLLPNSINAEVTVGYQFGPNQTQDTAMLVRLQGAESGSNAQLWIMWAGVKAVYNVQKKTLTFTLSGWTVGKLITEMMRMLDDPYFELEAPWNILNKISLDGLSVEYNLSTNPSSTSRISAKYSLGKSLHLGFFTMKGLKIERINKSVTIAIDGEVFIPGLKSDPLFNMNGSGQDVNTMPLVPGKGNELFDLRLLMLGQRVGMNGFSDYSSVKAIITALGSIPSTDTTTNPVDPGSTKKGELYYESSSNWLAAANFGILRIPASNTGQGGYSIECQFVFNDPNLYGLHLGFNGDKVKVLDGLSIDILYKKVTDDIGLYQLEFTLPGVLRNIDFGAYSITLPSIGVQIYTNGDFLFDLGFPYKLDFSRSFTLQAIIMVGPVPVPILGSAGVYIGKLSNSTAKNLPDTKKGTFDPVVALGIGMQLGFGKKIDKGVFKATFSITVFGILEGTIAPWHPYGSPTTSSNIEDQYYIWVQGTFGIIGILSGSVDFSVVSASVSITVKLYVQITFESHRSIPISATAAVAVKLSVKVNLGLFKIKLHFSFTESITVKALLGKNTTAPWDDGNEQIQERLVRQLAAGVKLPNAKPHFRQMQRNTNSLPVLTLTPAPMYTVLMPDMSSKDANAQEGAIVMMLAMDAPTMDGGNTDGSSFQSMCQALLPWVIDAVHQNDGSVFELDTDNNTVITVAQMEEVQQALSDAKSNPIPMDDILNKFLKNNFTVNIVPASDTMNEEMQSQLTNGATLFPLFPPLSLLVPEKDDATKTVTIDLDNYAMTTDAYRDMISQMFQELAIQVGEETGNTLEKAYASNPEPVSRFIFEDYFLLLARQLVQDALNAFDDYSYPLQQHDSVKSIIDNLIAKGNADITLHDILVPNLDHALASDCILQIDGILYALQRNDTLTAIAARYTDAAQPARWKVTPAQIILANDDRRDILLPGTTLTLVLTKGSTPYTVKPGDSFNSIVVAMHEKDEKYDINVLAQDDGIYGVPDMFQSAMELRIPAFEYTTAAGDTLQTIATKFTMEPLALFVDTSTDGAYESACEQNQNVQGLFDRTEDGFLQVARLESLYIQDIWDALVAEERVAATAGMAARYQLHGMRLPNESGLTLPQTFLYPASGQDGYGLYQLLGQQFPVPEAATSYSITLQKDDALDWVEFNGATETTTLAIEAFQQYKSMQEIVAYAQKTGYDPHPDITIESFVRRTPKQYALRNFTRWSTSGEEETLNALSLSQASAPQRQPLIWEIPSALMIYVSERQAALANMDGLQAYADQLPYLPALEPQIGVTDPAKQTTRFSSVQEYAFGLKVELQVKQLADPSQETGQHVSNSASNNYELLGVGPSDALLLERLLVAIDDSTGMSVVSGMSLAYENTNTDTEKLTGKSSAEFLSFITQTNLSTETNPPDTREWMGAREDASPPHGIAQSPKEFVTLLWELSTVRSGGYYLYYEEIASGAGLPASLFDSNGTATLTLIIIYPRTAGMVGCERLTHCVNAVITTSAIDTTRSVAVLSSVSQTAPSMPLRSMATLQDVARQYGCDTGTLMENNTKAVLHTGSVVPIDGVIHHVSSSDIASGDVWGTLATKYSQGANPKITAADIQANNPGIDPEIMGAIRIPEIQYTVGSDTTGPGNTPALMGAYYGLSMSALAYAIQDVPGLFPEKSVLTIDTILYDVKSQFGPGNIGIELTRANPGDPEEGQPDFAMKSLFELYSLLSAGVVQNAFFRKSIQGLPFGPLVPLTEDDEQTVRFRNARKAYMRSPSPDVMHYTHRFGFGTFASVNAAPDPDKKYLPPKSENPYIGVGTIVQPHFRWVDLFGNHILTPFSDPPKGYSGPLNNPPVFVGYSDALLAPGQWPNVDLSYTYDANQGSPLLEVSFTLNSKPYNPLPGQQSNSDTVADWQQNAQNDLHVFTRAYFQLHQNYDGLNIPGLSGNAVSMWLENTILETSTVPISTTDQDNIRSFVADCLVYVNKRASGVDGGTPPTLRMQLPVSVQDTAMTNIVPVQVTLHLERQACLCCDELRGTTNGLSAVTEIVPVLDTGEDVSSPYETFAQSFEQIMQTADWRFRLGAGAPEQEGTSGSALWAVRFGKGEHGTTGVTYRIGSGASFYAPAPVAKELCDASVAIGNYETGKEFPAGNPLQETLTGVDMNAWVNTVCAAVDTFLAAEYAAPSHIVDRLSSGDESDWSLPKILAHKKKLAGAIADSITPVLTSSSTDADCIKTARDKLYQSLEVKLSAGTALSAVTVFPVSNASINEPLPLGSTVPPRLYGQPVCVPGDESHIDPNDYSISSAKICLAASGQKNTKYVAFLVSSRNVAEQSSIALGIQYAVTHIEHNIHSVPGIEGYEQTAWISFITGPFKSDISTAQSPTTIPVVLRALPKPATVSNQRYSCDTTGNNASANISEYTYAFDYTHDSSSQDSIIATVRFNIPQPGRLAGVKKNDELFQALAQFVAVYPAIERDLDQYMRKIHANSPKDDTYTNALCALKAFESILEKVANTYDTWIHSSQVSRMVNQGGTPITCVYSIALRDINDEAHVVVSIKDTPVAGITIPPLVVAIDPDHYEYEIVQRTEDEIEYRYKRISTDENDVRYLSYEQALRVEIRTLQIPGLNVFAFQNGNGSVRVIRNTSILGGGESAIQDAFCFTTPEAGFSDPLVPLIEHEEYDLDQSAGGQKQSLENYLGQFFETLAENVPGSRVQVKLMASFAYSLVPDDENIPATVVPVKYLAPVPTILTKSAIPDFVTAIASAIASWQKDHAPVLNASSCFDFALDVFAGNNTSVAQQQPLLRIQRLYINANKIT